MSPVDALDAFLTKVRGEDWDQQRLNPEGYGLMTNDKETPMRAGVPGGEPLDVATAAENEPSEAIVPDIVLSPDEWALAKLTADRRTKANNGHSFITILKTRCQFCGRSPRAKGICRAWFQTFLWQLDTVLLNLERERDVWAAEFVDDPREHSPALTKATTHD